MPEISPVIHSLCKGCTNTSSCKKKDDSAQLQRLQDVTLGHLGEKFTCNTIVKVYREEHPQRKPLTKDRVRFHYGDVGYLS